MGPLPRTTKRITHELHTLLQNAGIHGPYIMVGHSFGGFTAQYFARYFNNEIVGIVLIDSSHEEQVYQLPKIWQIRPNHIRYIRRHQVGVVF